MKRSRENLSLVNREEPSQKYQKKEEEKIRRTSSLTHPTMVIILNKKKEARRTFRRSLISKIPSFWKYFCISII
jgi:polyphosphate kinase 2 (PPK2 family)